MLKSAERSDFLDHDFFEAKAIIAPALVGQEQIYLELTVTYQGLEEERVRALGQAERPLLEAQSQLSQTQEEVVRQRALLAPNPALDMADGGFRRSINRARVYLDEALLKNTVPWPLIWLARRLATPENPALSPFLQAVTASRTQLRQTADTVMRQREVLTHDYQARLDLKRKHLQEEEDRLLSSSEQAIAAAGNLSLIADYFTILPDEKREMRADLAVTTFVKVNTFTRLKTADERKAFEAYVDKMSVESSDPKFVKMAGRLKAFITAVGKVVEEPEDKRAPLLKALYHEHYVASRWEAYMTHSILNRFYKQGILNTAPVMPQIIQYW